MMDVEVRKGKNTPVIKKALVELKGPLYELYCQYRDLWSLDDHY
jgi:pyrophosphate--fructose-6-phosphate 1-phosphotransferase